MSNEPWKDYQAPAKSGPWDEYAEPAPPTQATPATPAIARPETGDFMRGFQRTLPELKQLAGGTMAAIGDVTGWDGLRDKGLDIYKGQEAVLQPLQKPTDSASEAWKQVKQGNLGAGVDFLQNAAGYTAGQALESLAAAGTGAAIGAIATPEVGGAGAIPGAIGGFVAKQAVKRAVKGQAEKIVAEQVAKGVAKTEAKKQAAEYVAANTAKDVVAKQVAGKYTEAQLRKMGGKAAGAALGAQGMNTVMELGSVYPEAYQKAQDEGREMTGGEKVKAVGASLAAAGLESAADLFNLGILFRGAKGAARDTAERGLRQAVKAYGKRAAVAGTEGALREAGTEAAQTGLERFGAGQSLNDPDAWRDYIDSAAVGAVGGVLFGGAAALRQGKEAGPASFGKDPLDSARADYAEAKASGDPSATQQAQQKLADELAQTGRVQPRTDSGTTTDATEMPNSSQPAIDDAAFAQPDPAQMAANMRMQAQVQRANAKTVLGRAAADATDMQADAVAAVPFDMSGMGATPNNEAAADGFTRLGAIAQGLNLDPEAIVAAARADVGDDPRYSLDGLDDRILTTYAQSLASTVQPAQAQDGFPSEGAVGFQPTPVQAPSVEAQSGQANPVEGGGLAVESPVVAGDEPALASVPAAGAQAQGVAGNASLGLISDIPFQQIGDLGFGGELTAGMVSPADWNGLRAAGLVQNATGEDGSPYEYVPAAALWDERERRSNEARSRARVSGMSAEEQQQARERRASNYDRMAQEQEDLGDLGDLDKAAELRAMAARVRAGLPAREKSPATAGQAPQAQAAEEPQASSVPGQTQAPESQSQVRMQSAAETSPQTPAATPAQSEVRSESASVPSPQATPATDSPQARQAAREANVPADLLAKRNAATERLNAASAAMQQFPTGNMGLTPDAVKATPEWKAAKIELDRATVAARNANAAVVKASKVAKPNASPEANNSEFLHNGWATRNAILGERYAAAKKALDAAEKPLREARYADNNRLPPGYKTIPYPERGMPEGVALQDDEGNDIAYPLTPSEAADRAWKESGRTDRFTNTDAREQASAAQLAALRAEVKAAQDAWDANGKSPMEPTREAERRAKVDAEQKARDAAAKAARTRAENKAKKPRPAMTSKELREAEAEKAQAPANTAPVDDLRRQLREVEAQILLKAPPKFTAGGGDIEGAAKHKQVPTPLKEQRKAIKAKLQSLQQVAPIAEATVPADSNIPPSAAAKTGKAAIASAKGKAEDHAAALASYFKPGNIIKSYAGYDEVLSYRPADGNRSMQVDVHEVRKVNGEWVRVGKPQDARWHSTLPDARELKAGPIDTVPAGDATYTEPRADGQPFPNAPRRGAQGATATHADPGEAPEAVTPAVIADAAKTADRAPTVSMAEARKVLLAKLDAAIKAAPNEGVLDNPPTTKASKNNGRKAWEVNIGRTLGNGLKVPALTIAESHDGNTYSIGIGGKVLPVGHKDNTLAKEGSLLAARLTAARMQQGADWKPSGTNGKWTFNPVPAGDNDMITLDVPGDGTFKVKNTKERLTAFRKQVESFFNLPKQETPKPESLTASQATRDKIMAEAETVGDAAPEQPAPTVIEHNGTRIYQARIRSGDEVVTRFAVESADNKARREAGERTIGGDSLHATLEAAKNAADMERKQKEQKQANDAAQKAASDAKAQADAARKADDLNGFTAAMSAMQAGKVKAALDKQVRFDGVVMTLRERVESLHSAGTLSVETFEEPAIKPMTRTQYNRATQREQDAHEAKMKAAGNKTVYLVNESDIGKTAYDYAQYLLAAQPAPPQQQADRNGVMLAKATKATKQQIAEREESTTGTLDGQMEAAPAEVLHTAAMGAIQVGDDDLSAASRRASRDWLAKLRSAVNQARSATDMADDARYNLLTSSGDLIAGVLRDEATYGKAEIDRAIKSIRGHAKQAGIESMTDALAAPKPAAQEASEPAAKIEDFGETLHGARKHYAQGYADRMKEAEALDVASNPLSKTWPEPDYEKLLEGGADPAIVAWVHAARDEIPQKPVKSWKQKGWAESVKLLREVSARLLDGRIGADRLQEVMEAEGHERIAARVGGRAALYQEVGHGVDLKGVTLEKHTYALYRGEKNVTKWSVEKPAKATAFSNWPQELGVGDTRDEAIAAFKANLDKVTPQAKDKQPLKFVIYSYRGKPGFVVGKKVGKQHIDVQTFDTVKEAREYLSNNQEALEAKFKKLTDIPFERRETNEPRVGVDHRNGADVRPEQFSETFGFRGVQFGNYVEGKRRQQDLNSAYDALLDMAGVLGIPPRSLSLNGTLGLAFGARGKGGKNPAAAHYEPDTVVINLTKANGAGSLAHEWWHGLDNYFGVLRDQSGKYGRADTYLTETAMSRPDLGPAASGGVRPEMVKAFNDVANVVERTGIKERSKNLDKRRTKAYWSTGREMTARSFESYIIARLADQNAANDYLANIVSEEAFGVENGYPYPTVGELAQVRAAYDAFFDTIESRETGNGNVALENVEGSAADWLANIEADESRTNGDIDADRLGLRKAVNGLLGKSGLRVEYLRGYAGLPEGLRNAVESRNAMGRKGQTAALYDPETKRVFVFTHVVRTPERAAWNAAHEIAGHDGLRKLLGKRLDEVLELADKNPTVSDLADEIAVQRKLTPTQRLLAVEEALAELAAAVRTGDYGRIQEKYKIAVPEGIRARVAQVVTNFLRRLKELLQNRTGVVFKDADVRALLENAWQAAQGEPTMTVRMPNGVSIMEQVVFHGTPHTVDKFSLQKIGTGEGAQAYGWGLYFASAKDIAKHYRDTLSNVGTDRYATAHQNAQNQVAKFGNDPEWAAEVIADLMDQHDPSDITYQRLKDTLEYIKNGEYALPLPSKGNLYRVDVPEDSDLLDWDKSLSEQPEKVREALQQAASPKGLGQIGARDADRFANVVKGSAFRAKGYRGLDVPSQRIVLKGMREVVNNLKVFDTVVPLIPVDMVNILRGEQFASEKILHDPSMFLDLLSTEGRGGVTLSVDAANAAIRRIADAASAEMFGVGDQSVRVPEDFLSALRAGDFNQKNGSEIYGAIQRELGSPQSASNYLMSIGISGTRYLDGNSRNPFPFDVQVFGKSGALLKYEKVRSRAAADAMVADAEAAGNTAKVIERPVEAGSANYVIWDESAIGTPSSALESTEDQTQGNPSILESVESVGDALASAGNSIRNVKLPAGYLLADLFGSQDGVKSLHWWDTTVGTQFNLAKKSPLFRRVFDSVQNMVADISHYANAAMDLAPNILPKFDSIKDVFKKRPMSAADAKKVSDAVFQGTKDYTRDVNGEAVKTSNVSEAGIVWTPDELRTMFGMTGKLQGNGKYDGQIGLYEQARAAIDRSLDDTAVTQMIRHAGEDGNAVRDEMLDAGNAQAAANILSRHLADQIKLMQGDTRSKSLQETAEQVQEIAKQIDKLKAKGYAPLSRFGRYTVYRDGDNPLFLMFETQREANRAARMLREKDGGKGITTGVMSQEQFKLFKGMTPETLELFGEMLGLDKTGNEQDDLVFQSFLKAAKSNRSALKRLIHRQGIEGYSQDLPRVLAAFLYSNARLAATNLHAPETKRAINDIPKEQGDLKDAAIKLNEYIVNPDDAGAFLSGFNFAQYLGGSIASAMVNMTQPLTMSFPWLSQYGGAWKAAKALGDAMKLVGKGGDTGNAMLDEALKRADADGHTQPQEVHQLQAYASGNGILRTGDGTKAGDAIAKAFNAKARVVLAWGVPFSLAEQFNRRTTFIAAFNMATEHGMPDPYGFAVNAVQTTQGIYNKANRPAWSRNAIGGMAFTFKTYSINYVEMLHRMWSTGKPGSQERKAARKGVLLAAATMFLLAGAGGLPGADDLDDIIDGLMQRLGYNFSSKQERERFFANLIGEQGASFMEHGLSAVPGMPIDVSGRLGMGNLIPSTGLFVRKADHSQDIAEIAGPTGDFIKRSGEAFGQLVEGNLGASMLAIAPRAAANAWKGVEMASTGEYRDTRGRKVLETTGLEAASKFIGFQPASVAKVQQASGAAMDLLSNYRIVSASIADRWAKGIHEQDPGEILLAQKELTDWNAKNPDMPIRIGRNALRSRVRNLAMDRRERLSKATPKAVRAQVETMFDTRTGRTRAPVDGTE